MTTKSLATRLRHEPLLRFGIVGVAIFAASAWLTPTTPVASDSIVIQQSRIDNWRDQFRSSNGRLPSPAELNNTITQWVDEEVLYRQALQLGLHQNDSIVRRQLIQKMDFVIEGATPLPPASDDKLQAFMENNPAAYGTPAKLSLQQVFFSRSNSAEVKAQQLLASLRQSDEDSYKGKGDSFILGQQITNADDQLLRKHFGKKFLSEVKALPASGGWQGPIKSGLGLHLVRITKRNEFQPPELARVRKKVALDYRLEQEQLARRKTLDKLQQQYRVEIINNISGSEAVANAQ